MRVIQEKTYEPLGSTKTEKVNVRFVTATNKDLESLVSEKKFREDLYYRINVVKLHLPPLRDRKEDIPLLVSHFLRRFNDLKGKNIQGLEPDVLPFLMSHDFPGNIRELENIIDYATVVCKNDHIGVEHLPDYLVQDGKNDKAAAPDLKNNGEMKEIESSYIYRALEKNNWNRKATAKSLGIHPSTLWRKIKQLRITLPNQDGRTRSS